MSDRPQWMKEAANDLSCFASDMKVYTHCLEIIARHYSAEGARVQKLEAENKQMQTQVAQLQGTIVRSGDINSLEVVRVAYGCSETDELRKEKQDYCDKWISVKNQLANAVSAHKPEAARVRELERAVASRFKWLAEQVRNGRRFPAAASIEGIAEWLESVSATSAGGE